MATDGPTPDPCRGDIYERGEIMAVLDSVPPNATERWVRDVAIISEQPVDWHYIGGRIVVRALGDLDRVRETLDLTRSDWEHLWRKHNPDCKPDLMGWRVT